jgi:hypothetical protein
VINDKKNDEHEMMTAMREAVLPDALAHLNTDMTTALSPQSRGSANVYSRLEK